MWNIKHWSHEEYMIKLNKAKAMFSYAVDLAEQQHALNCGFVIEHPACATSWSMPCVAELAAKNGCRFTMFDQCAVGLVSPTGEPMKKRTKFLSNLDTVHTRFSARQCQCQTPHRVIQGSAEGVRLSVWSQRYPEGLCALLVEAAAATAAAGP